VLEILIVNFFKLGIVYSDDGSNALAGTSL